jgi:RNA polymerase sigma factor (sigma-70 family)
MQKDKLNSNKLQGNLTALKQNDEASLGFFYRKNYQKVMSYVKNNSGTEDEAKDIYQEAFIAVWRNIQLDRFQPQNETALDGYLYQVSKNKWLDRLRAAKRVQMVALTELNAGADPSTENNEQEEQMLNNMKAKLKLLGDNCRDLLERFYYQKQSMRTISVAMEWTEATARNNKYRCIQRLRELLVKQ